MSRHITINGNHMTAADPDTQSVMLMPNPAVGNAGPTNNVHVHPHAQQPTPNAPQRPSQANGHTTSNGSSTEDPLENNQNYKTVQKLGTGASGFVHLAADTRNQNQHVAIKFLEKHNIFDKYLQREILHHRILQHPHIIQFREVFLTNQHICIAMEYASGGTLRRYIDQMGHLEESAARWFFQQLIIAVDYCHKKGVANRDLKLENTLLHWVPTPGLPAQQQLQLPTQPGQAPAAQSQHWVPLIKICDFGFSKADHQSAPRSRVGTLAYMAPEVITNSGGKTYDMKAADVWSCGIMLYVMLFGRFPFFSPQEQQDKSHNNIRCMLERIVRLQWTIHPEVNVSTDCRDLLQRILCPASQRISLETLQEHPWFLADLVPGARYMNASLLNVDPPTHVQTKDSIERVLEQAQTTYNMPEDEYERMIDETIEAYRSHDLHDH